MNSLETGARSVVGIELQELYPTLSEVLYRRWRHWRFLTEPKRAEGPGFHLAAAGLPARIVSGDYSAVLRFDDSHVGLCIADVTGKGMPAALRRSELQGALKALAAPGVSPKEVCERLNQIVSNQTAPNKFASFFYASLDARWRRLVYANAGHPAPVLHRRCGPALRLDAGGLLLGVFSNTVYEQAELEFAPGDRLMLFTDGLYEVMNDSKEEFGEERLVQTIRENAALDVNDLQNQVIATATAFCQGNFQDDATLMVVSFD